MEINIIPYDSSRHSHEAIADFEEVLYDSMLRYSMRHLIAAGISSREGFRQTLQRAMQICDYTGINIAHHFRQVYAYDARTGTMDIDWIMSRRGFKLVIMQYPELNTQIASWLWELSDL